MTLRLYASTGNKVLHLQTCIAKTVQSMSQSFHSKLAHKQACSVHCTIYSLWMGIMEIACFVLQEKILFWPCNKSFINCPSLFGQDGWIYILASFFLSRPSLHLSPVYEAYCAFSVNVVSAPTTLNTTFRNCTLSVQRSGYLFILL